MELSIIIVNYNTLDLTKACIESVRSHTCHIDYEIIVVDNDSTDGSREFFSNYENIVFIESGKNLGFGRANNLGYEHSKGRYLLMLNSDTIVENDILTRMVKHFDAMPDNVACIGSLLLHGNRQPSSSYGYFAKWRREFGFHTKKAETTSIKGNQQTVDYVSGADLFVRRNIANKYGLFDPDFFMYYEDMELGYRYRQHGFYSVIIAERGILHLEGASSKNSFRKICFITRSYLTYLRKTLSHFEYCFAKRCILLRRILTVWHYRWSIPEIKEYLNIILKA